MFGGQPGGTGIFGGQKTSIFGQSAAQPSGSLFGQATSTAVGSNGTNFFGQTQQQKPLFANTTTTQSSIFGAQPAAQPVGTGLFGTQPQQPAQTSLFGTNAVNNAAKPVFGFNSASTPAFVNAGTGTTVKFVPITATDTMLKNGLTNNINTRNMCITAMKQYEGRSLEELRLEDYVAGRKSGQPNALFGQQTSQVGQGGGIFGNAAQSKPAGGLFSIAPVSGAFTSNNFSNAAGTTGQTGGTGIFGGQKPSIFGQSAAQPSGSLFGQATSTAVGSSGTNFFGQTQQQKPLFTNTTTTQSSIFGAQPAAQPVSTGIFGTQPQQPAQTSLFGTNAAKPTFGFNATSAPAFGGMQQAFGTDASKLGQGTGIFGVTSTAGQTGSIFGGLSNAGQTGGLFPTANAAQKPGTSVFGISSIGNQQQPGIFGTLQTGNAGNNSLPASSASVSLGSRAQQEIIDAQLAALPYGDSPLLKTSHKAATTTEDSILQLQSHTTGGLQRQLRFLASKLDSPLSTSTVTSSVNSAPILSTSAASHSSLTSFSSTSNRLPFAGTDLNTSGLMNGSFSYKPLISLPSVGFGAALGLSSPSSYLNSPNGHSLKNRSFLAQDDREIERGNSGVGTTLADSSRRAPTGRKAKALDISVIHNQSPFQSESRASVGSANKSELQTPLTRKDTSNKNEGEVVVPKFPNIDSANSPSVTDNLCVNNAKFVSPPNSEEHRHGTSTQSNNTPFEVTENSQLNQSAAVISSNSSSPVTSPNTRKSEYYTKPTVNELRSTETSLGTFRIDSGLTVGRLGYGSVFWPGPFELKELNFEDIVRFRTKEVVIYPDESQKPPVGEGLNRPAEVSLERVWPVGKNKEPIKSPQDLVRLKFREKLVKLCERMDAEFREYNSSTGSWHFRVQHFSKYGYYEDDDEDALEQLPTEEELELSRQHQQMLYLTRQAKTKIRFTQEDFQCDSNIPTNTRQVNNDGVVDDGGKGPHQLQQNNKIIPIFDNISLISNQNSLEYPSKNRLQDVLNRIKTEVNGDEYEEGGEKPKSSLFTEQHVPTKRVKLDDLLIRSRQLLKDVSMRDSDGKQFVPSVPVLVERSVVNVFKGITREMLDDSVIAVCSTSCPGLRRSCRVGFGPVSTILTTSISGEHSTVINISNITTVVCFEEYLKRFLVNKDRLSELADLKRTELLRWDPPSTLLKLIDSYIVKLAQANDTKGDDKLWTLCDALILPPSPSNEINQRHLFGNWLRQILMTETHANVMTADAETSGIQKENKFRHIYQFLVNGAVRKATECARDARLYDLAMIISMFTVPPGTAIQGQIAEQLNAHRKLTTAHVKKDIYYERILELLSGSWRPTQGAKKESWMQALGVIVWYFAKPSTPLSECVQLYEQKFN